MKKTDGASTSSWYRSVKVPAFRNAPKSSRTDVCIVGAGIAGLTVAYLLALEGKKVVVLDEGPVGGGQTGRTSAHLASAIDDRFVEIERMHGKHGARLAFQSHALAIDTIERIAREEKIRCDFARLDAFLSSAPSDPPNLLDLELAAAKRAGMPDVEKVAGGGLDRKACLRFGQQARFHPILYLIGLTKAIKRMGGKIYVGRRVRDVQGADTKRKTPAYAELSGGVRISADSLVVATNTPSPINDWFGIYTKQAAYRTYLIGAVVPKGSVPDALYWDTADPYHYVRLQMSRGNQSDLLLIGGEDHKVGQIPMNGAQYLKLEQWGRQKFPKMQRVRYRWSGQVQEPADGVAFIGRALTAKPQVYVATGDSGMGLTHGTIAGLLITDLIMGRKNPWEQLYDPSRKIMNREFIRENANTVAQYKDLVTPGDVASVEEIPRGQGAVMRDGISKLAVYRDATGKIHRHSAVCTHLQCIVQWNHIEKSWDCPCHGSRFDPTGKVLMGPAIDDLPSVK